ncbi:MAG TPA: glycosyltransferase family 39 protein [Mucilaginibacter sp.]|jgi:4-amino-4-deoxy-L-arabinose transferase-like glycosyltransferase|nr:glycosyltransferase family 39 protein [Mucilaginibacter sp.]
MFKKLLRNPWFIFLPFLIFYIYQIIINKWPTLYGDEIRYVDFAWGILHGYYSPPPPHINLWNGPGYPLVIVPFMAMHVHALYITLLNAVFLYLAIVFLYKSLELIANRKIALIFSLLLALYPNNLSILPILYTEAFTSFLISSFIYAATLCFTRKSTRYGLLAGFLLGYLVLTKVIFGYVLIIALAVYLLLLLFRKERAYYLRPAYILLTAFIVTLPWLAYTYHITGRAFYWGDSGGMSLYWMSSPYDNEYGDWKIPELTNHQYPISFKSAETVAILKKNHSKEMAFILKHNELEQDDLFKQAAIHNIRQHPGKFAVNYYYNWSRMLFNFPYSYSYQDGAIVGNILRGSLILWVSVIGLISTFINWRRICWPVKFSLFLTAIYLLLSGALSAYPRQLDVVLPVLLFWIGFLAANTQRFNLKFEVKENPDNIN